MNISGSTEKMAGKVTGSQGLVQQGEARKVSIILRGCMLMFRRQMLTMDKSVQTGGLNQDNF